MKKKIYLFTLLVLGVCGLRAQYVAPAEGLFRIVNVEYGSALTENYVSNSLLTTQVGGNADFDQLWFLKGAEGSYTIQNAYTRKYIQTGNNVNEQPYWTGAAPKNFNIVANSNKGANAYNIWDPTLGSQGLHSKGVGERVVRWGTENDKAASEWRFVKVEVSEDALKEAQAEYAAYEAKVNAFEEEYAYLSSNVENFENALAKYFEDAACTVLKSAYATMSDEELRSAMTADALPAILADMAVKVKNGNWAEPNEKADKPAWDSPYGKKFRVQLIEPHSIAGEITSWLGYNAHTNMDNPTGLYANNFQVVYIMVEGEIREGAELWATWLNGHTKMPNYNNGYSNGVRLQEGLNIVPVRNDGSAIYINYLVHTYQGGRFTHKLSEHDNLKVHIEGGYINSYYNSRGDALYTADTDADWVYYEERANLRNITLLAKYQVLQFELNDVTITEVKDGKTNTWTDRGLAKLFPDELPASLPENQRINTILEAWDRIMLSEMMTLGVASKEEVDSMNLLFPRWDGTWENKADIYNYEGYAEYCEGRDYSEYYNHRGLAFGTTTGYMYGSWDHCGYHINTTPSILTAIATEAGPAWGPAHEIGHQHQGLFTVNGLTEVTNNLFSNIAVWYMGMGTSRINGSDGNLEKAYEVFRDGGDFFGPQGQHIWVNTQMYYRLWLYYHRAGHDTQFYPKLFELLRRNPIARGYYQQGKYTLLHFYKMCCEAAQEDLTEFFRAYGFFRVMNNRFVGDYSNSEYTQSQDDIDAAIAWVKEKGYPVNHTALLINDCTPDVTYGHDGKTERGFWDGSYTSNGTNGETGSYVDFLKGEPITGTYLYTLNNGSLKISGGDGALGFLLFNSKDELVAFSNHHSFTVTNEVSNMIKGNEVRVMAMGADGNHVQVISKTLGGSEKEQLTALKKSLTNAATYLATVDKTGLKAGYFIPEYLVTLQEIYDEAAMAVDSADQSKHAYGEWAVLLDEEMFTLLNTPSAFVPVYEESYYSITAKANIPAPIEYNSGGLRGTYASAATDKGKHWVFVSSGVEGEYFIQNRESGNYISVVNSGEVVKANSSKVADAVAFKLAISAPGYFTVQCVDDPDVKLYYSNKNVTASPNAASWALEVMEDLHTQAYVEDMEALLRVADIIKEELIKEADPVIVLHSDVAALVDNLNELVQSFYNAYVIARKALENGESAIYLAAAYDELEFQLDNIKGTYRKSLTLPEASVGDDLVVYYIQSLDNDGYAYVTTTGSTAGRIRTSELTDGNDYNYWFYLRKGETEGTYSVHSIATGNPVSISGRYLMANEEAESPVTFRIAPSTDYGFVVSNEDGYWCLQASMGYAQFKSTDVGLWKFQKIGVFTGIQPNPVINQQPATGIIYDLQGRPVDQPTQGIYIRDGKKFVVK